jgi:hypothetical protein
MRGLSDAISSLAQSCRPSRMAGPSRRSWSWSRFINIIANLIDQRGLENMVLTLRIMTESNPANRSQLNRAVIFAVNDICRLRPFTDLGLALLEAFDEIDLGTLHAAAKAERLSATCGVQTLLACIIIGRLERILEPLFPKPVPKPVKVKREPKPPRSLTRSPASRRTSPLGSSYWTSRQTQIELCLRPRCPSPVRRRRPARLRGYKGREGLWRRA